MDQYGAVVSVKDFAKKIFLSSGSECLGRIQIRIYGAMIRNSSKIHLFFFNIYWPKEKLSKNISNILSGSIFLEGCIRNPVVMARSCKSQSGLEFFLPHFLIANEFKSLNKQSLLLLYPWIPKYKIKNYYFWWSLPTSELCTVLQRCSWEISIFSSLNNIRVFRNFKTMLYGLGCSLYSIK